MSNQNQVPQSEVSLKSKKKGLGIGRVIAVLFVVGLIVYLAWMMLTPSAPSINIPQEQESKDTRVELWEREIDSELNVPINEASDEKQKEALMQTVMLSIVATVDMSTPNTIDGFFDVMKKFNFIDPISDELYVYRKFSDDDFELCTNLMSIEERFCIDNALKTSM